MMKAWRYESYQRQINRLSQSDEEAGRTALTESFIKSLKLLADTVESQMEEVK